MEFTVEKTLQQAIAAHKAGKLEDAQRLYTSILQAQPAHPDANHNLGGLLVSVDKVKLAIPFFKAALEANPNIEQFWMSYIDALVKNNQLKDAKRAIKKAKKKGFDAEKLQALLPQSKGVTDTKAPSQELLNSLLEQYQNGRLSEAEKLAVSVTREFPQHQFGWKVLAAVLKKTGRVNESLVASQKSLQIDPQDAEALSNLGNTLRELGRLDEALAVYTQAIALKRDYVDGHFNLANTLNELGRLNEAVASYRQSIELQPGHALSYNNLGITLQELGRFDDAIVRHRHAISLTPDFADAHTSLGRALLKVGHHQEALSEHMISGGVISFNTINGFSLL